MLTRSYNSTRTHRPAFTLVELLLVLAVLVVVVSLTTPSIGRMFQRQGLDSGASRIRAAMGNARVKAIKNGEVYCLFIARGSNWFDVAPFTEARQQISRMEGTLNEASRQSSSNLVEGLLPRGILFQSGEIASDARGAQLISDTGTDGSSLEQILFYPDGTSQDARVVVENEFGGAIEIQLRGLTGMSKSIRLKQVR